MGHCSFPLPYYLIQSPSSVLLFQPYCLWWKKGIVQEQAVNAQRDVVLHLFLLASYFHAFIRHPIPSVHGSSTRLFLFCVSGSVSKIDWLGNQSLLRSVALHLVSNACFLLAFLLHCIPLPILLLFVWLSFEVREKELERTTDVLCLVSLFSYMVRFISRPSLLRLLYPSI